VGLDIIELTEEKKHLWDKFCLDSDDAWFWHTTRHLDYCICYGWEKHKTRNISFYVCDDCGILAVCPLLLEKTACSDGATYLELSMSGNGGKLIVPALRNDLSAERREKILKLIFERIDLLAKENNVVKSSFRMTPLSMRVSEFNWLVKFNYLECTLNTQIIDLDDSLEHLFGEIRKGHRHNIRQGEKEYKVHIYDQKNPDKEVFDNYRLLHHKAAGRITRPIETFEIMYDYILSGNGMLCGVSKNNNFGYGWCGQGLLIYVQSGCSSR